MILNLDVLIYNLLASLELRLMCSLLTFQVSRTNLELFYETTCRGELCVFAQRQSRGIFEMKPANVQASPFPQTILKRYCT